MKNINFLLLLALSFAFFSSCQQDAVESTQQELFELERPVPAEDENPEQYIGNDEKLPKAKVTEKLLARAAAHRALQAENNELEFRSPGTACEGVDGDILICEDFDSRNTGSVAANSTDFEQWNPDAQNDGQIVQSGPGKILRMDRRIQSQTHSDNEEDDIFLLGDANQGCYNLHFEMYIGSCRTAYFDLQKQLRQEVLAAFVFNKFGKGEAILPDGSIVEFDYPVGQWFDVDIHFNANNRPFNPTPPFNMVVVPDENELTVTIADRLVADISIEDALLNLVGINTNQLQGVDFYPLFRSSKFYLDNFCFTYLGDPSIDGLD